VGAEVPYNGHDDSIACKVVGIVVASWNGVRIRNAHQARGFARRQQAAPDALTFDDQNDLTAGSACWSAEASGNIVKAHLGSLDLSPSFVWSGAFVYCAYHPLSHQGRRADLFSVDRRHHCKQAPSFELRVPCDA